MTDHESATPSAPEAPSRPGKVTDALLETLAQADDEVTRLRGRLLGLMRRMDCRDLMDDAFYALVQYERALRATLSANGDGGTYARHDFKRGGGPHTEATPEDRCVWRVDGHSPYCGIAATDHDDVLARRRGGQWHWPSANDDGGLDVERLRHACRNVERREDRALVWGRDAEAVAAEYAALASPKPTEGTRP